MPGRRIKERVKVKWSLDSLEKAFYLVASNVSIRKAARDTGVPFSTLQERLKLKNKEQPRLGRNTVFSSEQETDMANQIKLLAKIFYGCTSLEIRKMAYEYAEKNNIPHNFINNLGMAGRDWLKGFMQRNKLSSRKAEGTSINRATAFNKEEVSIFFELLGKLMDKFKFLSRNIYNVDETGVSSVQDVGKIITEKGQRRVGSITSGERGKNVTAVCAMSATGVFIPPMFIYPRQRHSVTLEVDGPRGAIYKCSKNGWINEELFIDWMKHFYDYTKPSENEPILLVLDNHASHISLKVYEFCKTNHIVMLSLPPHGSHRMQPLDVSVYGPLKRAYKQEVNLFMKSNMGRQIAQTDIASLFRKAFQKTATIPKAESGFAATGIYPYNPDVFSEDDFLAAEFLNTSEPVVLDQELYHRNTHTPESQIVSRSVIPSPSTISNISDSLLNPDLINFSDLAFKEFDINSPNPFNLDNVTEINHSVMEIEEDALPFNESINVNIIPAIDYDNPIPSTSKEIITAKDLIPVPKPTADVKKRSNRKQHAIVITAIPLKTALMEKENRKVAKLNKKKKDSKITTKKIKQEETKIANRKNINTKGKNTKKRISKKVEIQRIKRKVLQVKESNTSNSEIDMKDLRDDDDTDIDEDSHNKCIICEDYGRDNELWFRCVLCGKWAHEDCSGYDSPDNYKCDLCIAHA